MSTHIDQKQNGCYSLNALRMYGGKDKGVMVQFTVSNGTEYHCVALSKQDAIDFCVKVIASLNELPRNTNGN